VLPFIQWRDAKYTIEISRTEYQEAAISFRSTFYRALSDVENALSARARLAEQNESLNGALQDAGRAERLSEIRYRAGAVALTSWLDAQQTRRIAEEAWALNRFNQLAAQVALYEALGGA
jgi:outer membrane protein TolC